MDSNEWHELDSTDAGFKPKKVQWSVDFKLCAYRGLIYKILSNHDLGEPAITCYDPTKGTWQTVIEGCEGQYTEAIFVNNDVLYVIWETSTDDDEIQSIEYFDVEAERFSLVCFM